MGHREGAHRPPRLLLFRSLGLDPPNRIEHDAGRRDPIAIEPPDTHHAAPGSGGVEGRRVLKGEQRRLVAGHLWRGTSASSVERSISLALSRSSSSMRSPRILLASDTVPAAMKDRLRALAGTLDPLGLLDEIRAVQHHLAGLAAGSTVHPMPQRDADLDGFLRSLALAWRAGEVRPTHQPRKRPPRHWRTRQDPFETTWPGVVESGGAGALSRPLRLTAALGAGVELVGVAAAAAQNERMLDLLVLRRDASALASRIRRRGGQAPRRTAPMR